MDWKKQPESFWKERLDDETFRITRQHGTERAFTGALLDNKKDGEYVCVCCGTPLFTSDTKFDSGSGWPSFFAALKKEGYDPIEYKSDDTLGMRRVEIICKTCGCHLGHVFPDGPGPEGQRYCVNSASLKFEEKKK